jgi:O-antigen biosynthesis protein
VSLRFFIASGCAIATTTLYRCVHLQEHLQDLGYNAEVAEWFEDSRIDASAATDCDVLILYRLAMSTPLRQLIECARALGRSVIFDTDDLIFEPELVEWHRGVRNLSKAEQQLHLEGVRRYLETLQACGAIMTATPLLAELARKRGKPAFVHRNSLGKEMLAFADRLYEQRRPRHSNHIVIGYGSGTPTHDVDFQEATGALENVLDRFAQVELCIAGPLTVSSQLAKFGNRVQRYPLMDWRGWFELMSTIDISISPLERDNIFCRAKSEIKFVEAGALGIAVVASDVDPFRDSISHGEDGLLVANEKQWIDALTLLIEQPEMRKQMGENARGKILRRYSPRARTAELSALLPELLSSVAGSPAAAQTSTDK